MSVCVCVFRGSFKDFFVYRLRGYIRVYQGSTSWGLKIFGGVWDCGGLAHPREFREQREGGSLDTLGFRCSPKPKTLNPKP